MEASVRGKLDTVRIPIGTEIDRANVEARFHEAHERAYTFRLDTGIEFVNDAIRRLAAEHGAHLVEVSGHPGLNDSRNFAADGLHPSPLGHRRAARGFAAELRAAGFAIETEDEIAWSK